MQKRFGKLTVKMVGGVEIKNQGFGKSDPYCKVRIGSQEFQSRVHSGGGTSPVWGDMFDFDIANEREMQVEVWDKQAMGNDRMLGSAKANIMAWISTGSYDGEIALKDRGTAAGAVKVSVKFERPKGGQMVVAPPSGIAPPRGMPAPPGAPPMNEAARDPNDKFTDKEIKEAFEAFDLDHNTFVGAAEIRHVLINIGENVTDEEVDEMIRMVDKDGDGQVSFDEFYEMVTGGKKPPPSLTGAPGGAMAPPSSKAGGGGGATPIIQQRNARKNALDDFAREYNIKPESIKKAYKRFQETDVDHSGLIEYVEFCEILQVEPSPQVEKLFQLFDKDRSGQIDVKEFMIGLSNFTGAGKEEKLKFAFMVFDDDGNGVITKQELLKILKANHMAGSDKEVMRKADTIMTQADKDGDGVISFDEFVIVSKKFPNILFPAYSLGQKVTKRMGI